MGAWLKKYKDEFSLVCVNFEIFVGELLKIHSRYGVAVMWNSGEVWLEGRLVCYQPLGGPWSQDDREVPLGELREKEKLNKGGKMVMHRTSSGTQRIHSLAQTEKKSKGSEGENEYWSHRWWGKCLQKQSGVSLWRDLKTKAGEPD